MAIEVRKKENESVGSMLRRFSRMVQASGLINQARDLRFKKSAPTRRQKKLSALHRAQMRNKFLEMYKMGKIDESKKKGRRR